jgi:acyl-CoA synthetase (AMP-forming)/AMP-acid ligase II
MSFDVETLRGRRADRRWNRMAVGDILERVTWSRPHKTALVGWAGAFSDPRFERLTYAEADALANQVAHALLAEGAGPGDRVLLYCDNSVEAVLTMVGVAKAGMVVVPVNSLLAPDVLAHALELVEPRLVVADAGLLDRGRAVLAAHGTSPSVVIEIGGTADGAPGFAAWIEGRPTTEVDVDVHGDDIWALLFTSGTTSMPKASMTAHTFTYLGAYVYALSLTRGLRDESDSVMASFLPLIYHCGHNSTLFTTWMSGGTAVIGRRPDEHALAEAITRERVTAIWAGSPLWVERLVSVAEGRDDVDLSSLTVVMFSWGAMREDLLPRLSQVAPHAQPLEVFGQTEAQTSYRFWPLDHPERAAEAVAGTNHIGLPPPLLAADIRSPDGTSLAGRPGEAGEVVYRSPLITQGYYRNPEATAEAFRGGWFHSGDSCRYVEADARDQVMVDRLKDVVKSGGENVSSLRVENVVAEHPGIARAAVVGVPDEKWGELVTAVVSLAPGAAVSEEELIAWARERLAGYETPKRVVFVADFPVTVGGKVRKHELRDRLADG